MSGVQFDIKVVTGNSGAAITQVIGGVTTATEKVNGLTAAITKIGNAAFAFNNIKSALSGIAEDFKAAVQPGIDFNDTQKDLQALTGVNDEQLKKIGESARDSAKKFGIDASGAVDSYKIILSKLGPEIANNSAALSAMGNNAVILSKQMNNDVTSSTIVLTTAMNQYGVSMDDPMKASKEMAGMMNIMAAAAKEGSAELPEIKNALEQSGMMAKTAGVSFGELNSYIQVLDKAGKKGAEGGVAIRNVIADISQGNFMHKRAKEVLEEEGISAAKLADKHLTLSERLNMLKPIVGDTAKMVAVFGKENVAAAIAAIQNTKEADRLTEKTKGTQTAVEMANIKMSSYKEMIQRVTSQFKDWGISIFNAMQPMMPFLSVTGSALKLAGDMGMAINGVSILAETKFGAAIGRASSAVLGFAKNIVLGTFSLVKQAAQMAISAAMTVGGFVASLITATAAQWGLNIAMDANPIGLLVLGIGAAVAAIAVLIHWWDDITNGIKSAAKFFLDHNPFAFIINVVDKIFPGFKAAMEELWGWIKKKFTDLIKWFSDTWKSIKGVFGFHDDKPGTKEEAAAVSDAVTKAVADVPIKVDAVVTDDHAGIHEKSKSSGQTKTSKEMATNISSGGSKPTTIHLTIHKLQDQIVLHTTNLQMGAKEAGKQIVEEILMALNSVNGKVASA